MICVNCKKPCRQPDQLLIESGLDLDQYREFTFYEGEGCLECNGTGFRGRTAIHELLDLSDKIREMIIERRPTSEIKRAAREDGLLISGAAGVVALRARQWPVAALCAPPRAPALPGTARGAHVSRVDADRSK